MATLYIVATPIGNLKDITLRALETLDAVAVIAAEDTRVAKKLLTAHNISTPLISYHQHNAAQRDPSILAGLQQGKNTALITDAGTPLISDPGHSLVEQCRTHGFDVVPIPGASAIITALCVNNINVNRFCFEGYLPPKRAARVHRLQQLRCDARGLILYEAKHRIVELLEDISSVFGPDRTVMIARELTKMHEQIVTDSVTELLVMLENGIIPCKGEFVVLCQGDDGSVLQTLEMERMRTLYTKVADVLSHKDAVALAQSLSTLPKNTLYKLASEYYPAD